MKTILTLLVAAILCGCASVGKNFDSRKVTEIKKGTTTEAELHRMFGPPANRSINSEGTTSLHWIYTQAQAKGATFIPVVGMFAGGVDTKSKTLFVSLRDGVVTEYSYSGGDLDTTSWVQSDPENKSGTNAPAPKVYRSPKAQ